jgi:hypothetical protein
MNNKIFIDLMNTTPLIDLLTSSLVTLLGAFVSWYLRYKYGEYKQKKMNREVSQSKLIQTILEQQLNEYGCQRAFILQRHNGGKYGTGKSMNKLSTTFEALEEGVSTEFKEYQNLPTSLYTGLIEKAMKNQGVFPIVENIEDLLVKAFFVQRGSKSAIVYPIKQDKEMVGIVGFEWTHVIKDMESLLKNIKEDGEVIGETLSKLL